MIIPKHNCSLFNIAMHICLFILLNTIAISLPRYWNITGVKYIVYKRRNMPSRKRNKGKERKAKKAELEVERIESVRASSDTRNMAGVGTWTVR